MDAFTQLLEAYTSTAASPMTDALAINGLKYMKNNIVPACTDKANNINVRVALAYGSLLSGICLANAGLGIIHGLASPIGGFFDIPHGVVCGTLLAAATKMNVEKLKAQGPKGMLGLKKYADVGAMFAGKEAIFEKDLIKYSTILVDTLEVWTDTLHIDPLGIYGITAKDVNKIVDHASLKNNPVPLGKEDIKKIVLSRL